MVPYFPYFVTVVNHFTGCNHCVQLQSPTLDGWHVCNSSSAELLRSGGSSPSPPYSYNVFSLLGWRRRRTCASSLSSHSAAAFTTTLNVTKRPRCFHTPSVYSILTWKWTLWKFWACEEPRRYFHLNCHGSNNTLCLQPAVHLVTSNCFAAAAEWEAEVAAVLLRAVWGTEQGCRGGV